MIAATKRRTLQGPSWEMASRSRRLQDPEKMVQLILGQSLLASDYK
jgi:hypothetical protein